MQKKEKPDKEKPDKEGYYMIITSDNKNFSLRKYMVEKAMYAFKIKNTQNPKASMLHGLNAFKEDYPIVTTYLLHRGTQRLKIGEVICLPIEQFLKELVPNNLSSG